MIVGFTSIYVFCNEIPITNYVCDIEACGTSWRVKCIDFCILFEEKKTEVKTFNQFHFNDHLVCYLSMVPRQTV
jgi:hypothetical protein